MKNWCRGVEKETACVAADGEQRSIISNWQEQQQRRQGPPGSQLLQTAQGHGLPPLLRYAALELVQLWWRMGNCA